MTKKRAGFTAEERAAMRDRVQELKATSRGVQQDGAAEVLAKIAEMEEPDRVLAERLHAVITASAPDPSHGSGTGCPHNARDGKLICHFQSAQKFKSRYATLGFSDNANLDDGAMWPTAYAVMKLTATVEKRIVALLTQAVS